MNDKDSVSRLIGNIIMCIEQLEFKSRLMVIFNSICLKKRHKQNKIKKELISNPLQ